MTILPLLLALAAARGPEPAAGGAAPAGPRFEEFAVPVEEVAHPARPVLRTAEERRYRTQLRNAAKGPPNFAGHLRVAEWGCGACCVRFAVVDLGSGEVFLPPFYLACGSADPTDPVRGRIALDFRPDSSLLVATGTKDEGNVAGIWAYRWNGRALVLEKVVREVLLAPRREDVEAALQRYSGLMARMDHEAIAALYEEDGVMAGGGPEPVRGRAAILAHLCSFAAFHVESNELTSDAVALDGPVAHQRGTYHQRVRLPDGEVVETRGTFEAEWRFDADGVRRIARMETAARR